jgi:tetratricopeptide (TPR) repeat protein
MRRLIWWQLAALLFAAAVAVAQVQAPTPSAQAAGNPPEGSAKDQAPTSSDQTKQQVTITAPREQLPELRSDEYSRCMGMVGAGTMDYVQSVQCEAQLTREKHIVVDACVNAKGDSSASRVVEACTESLDRNIFEGNARFFLFASRAAGYLAQGDKQHALDDYNETVKLAPRNAFVYFNRGLFYEAQSDNDAALRDFDAAIGINSKLVPALRQRARLYQARGNLSGARDEYSKAIDLEPKIAALWSERGYVALRQKDYENAVKDEAEAIRLDPALARAYYLRGAAAAFGGLGHPGDAVDDIKTAVGLDQSLAVYVKTEGKTASLTLPPF